MLTLIVANRFTIHGYDLVSFLHGKHGRAVYVRESLIWLLFPIKIQQLTATSLRLELSIANVYRPPREPCSSVNLLPTLPHPWSCLLG